MEVQCSVGSMINKYHLRGYELVLIIESVCKFISHLALRGRGLADLEGYIRQSPERTVRPASRTYYHCTVPGEFSLGDQLTCEMFSNRPIRFVLLYLIAAGCCYCTEQTEIDVADNATKELWTAVDRNDPTAAWSAIRSGANIESRNPSGFTPLHLAAVEGHVEVTGILLRANANKEVTDSNDDRPLHLAVAKGRDSVVTLLVVAGADLLARGQGGLTPLQQAAGDKSTGSLLLALSHSQVVQTTDPTSPHPFAARTSSSSQVVQTTDPTSPHPLAARTSSSPQVAQTTDLTASRSSQPEVRRDSVAIKVLFDAVERNDPEAVREAINNGSDINGRNATGFTPLHVAAAEGHVKAMSVLLMAKANKEAANDDGDRPLHLAAANGNSSAAGLLVVAGADLNATGQDGSTPVLRAAGHNSTVALLHSLSYFQMGRGRAASEAAAKALLDAVERNDPQAVRAAIENGADIERRDSIGDTALHLAAIYDSNEAMCVLLRAGADTEAVDSDHHRPLHYAAGWERQVAVALLAVAGADLHSRGYEDRTPLQWAALYNYTSTAALLRSLGG